MLDHVEGVLDGISVRIVGRIKYRWNLLGLHVVKDFLRSVHAQIVEVQCQLTERVLLPQLRDVLLELVDVDALLVEGNFVEALLQTNGG